MDREWYVAVLKREGLDDWNIVWAADGYCWFHSKTIQLPHDASEALFLHEIAHALCPDPELYGKGLHYHGGMWASIFGRLVDKYMQPVRLTTAVPDRKQRGN